MRLSAALATLAALGLAPAGDAESALSLPRPRHFGEIPAQTLDESGHRLGDAELRIEELPNGNVSFLSESHIDGGAANRLTAELAPVGDGAHLRPLFEESRSDVSAGRALGTLRIDHGERVIRCTSAA